MRRTGTARLPAPGLPSSWSPTTTVHASSLRFLAGRGIKTDYGGDGTTPCPLCRDIVTPPYPPKQCAAVRTQERPTSTPPHMSSPCSRTDTSQGQAPLGATLPPMIRPRGTVALP